jgi:hypothetical protein
LFFGLLGQPVEPFKGRLPYPDRRLRDLPDDKIKKFCPHFPIRQPHEQGPGSLITAMEPMSDVRVDLKSGEE